MKVKVLITGNVLSVILVATLGTLSAFQGDWNRTAIATVISIFWAYLLLKK